MNEVIVELAFGADLSADPSMWDWVDVSGDTLRQDITIQRGRSDEAGQVQPTTVGFELDNLQGHYTPDNPVGQHYPDVRRGTPCRISVPGAERFLSLDGSTDGFASTPDHASLDITGDIDLRAEVDIGWLLSANQVLIGKWETAGNQRSYLVRLLDGLLTLNWSVDGTAAGQMFASWPLPGTIFGRVAVRATLDVNNGAGGWTASFFTAPNLQGTWTQAGDPVVVTGTTSIFSGTAPLRIAPNDPGTTPPRVPFTGHGYRFELRSGIGGTVVANPDFRTQAAGATTFADAAGRTWTVSPPAEIADRQVRFLGHVDEWAPTWPYGDHSGAGSPAESRVHVAASGMLRRMSQGAKSLQSTLYRRITSRQLATNVIAYWPFEEGSEATAVSSPVPGVRPLWVSENISLGSDGSLPASLPLAQVNGSTGVGWSATVPRTTTGAWRVDMFVRIPTPAASPAFVPLFVVTATGSIRQWTVEINDTNIRLRGSNSAGTQVLSSQVGPPPPDFSRWHSVSLLANQNGANVDWGVQWIPLGEAFGVGWGASFAGQAGRVSGVANLYVAPSGGVSFGHLVVTRGLSIFWLAGADIAFTGETAGQRIVRLCAEEHVPLITQGALAESEPVGPQRPVPLLDLLQEAARADTGLLYERRDSQGLAYRTGRSFRNQAVALALDAEDGDIVNPLEPVLDDQRLRNDITVSRQGGSSARVVDQASVSREGRYDEQITVQVHKDVQLEDQAAWRLRLGTWPGMRYPTLTTDLVVAPHLADEWLALDLGDRVETANLPPQHPTDAVGLLVEGYAETITPTEWKAKLNCSPAGPWSVGELQVGGTPTVDMDRLDTDGSALAAALTSTQTSLSVTVTAGPLWTTATADAPFDIVVGGERMRVTQVTGTSSPQAFTVQRSVNQIVKPHAAGTAVRVARPFVLDL